MLFRRSTCLAGLRRRLCLDDIELILASFRAASAANAADREKIDAAEADAAFDQIASAQVPVIMQHKAQVLIGQMRRPGGLPQVSERQLEEANSA